VSEHGVSWDEDDSHDAVPWLELAEGQTRLDVAERLAQAHLSAGRPEDLERRVRADRRRYPRPASAEHAS
jgi:hypothetical protein